MNKLVEAFKSRQLINILIIIFSFMLFFFIFIFLVLIPVGKEYKKERKNYLQERRKLRHIEDEFNQANIHLNNLQKKHASMSMAFNNPFNTEKFKQQYSKKFQNFSLTELKENKFKSDFTEYEVNASTHITTPKYFYEFLNELNSSKYIIQVNFPINFQKENDLIKASFSMKVFRSHFKPLENNSTN